MPISRFLAPDHDRCHGTRPIPPRAIAAVPWGHVFRHYVLPSRARVA
jgi:hypothetical protein